MNTTSSYPLLIAGLFLSSNSIPDGATAVQNFDLNRYLGRWYEIARLDYYWEKNLDNVTATYSLKPNGDIKVDNRGRDTRQGKWKESIGKAKPVDDPKEAKLKVSFFGPFYAGYNVIAIDKDYKYALVVGENRDYMWILSRTQTIPDAVRQEYLNKARAIGYDVSKLVWVKQDRDK
jgi:apolipoprotein D and lipocalin family protein